MKIDDAIIHANEVAKRKYAEGMLCHANPNDEELDSCIECAKEHEQLAKWLEKLKQYEEMEKTKSVFVTTLVDGVTECCGYDFGLDGFGNSAKRIKYCPICSREIVKIQNESEE